jgi:fructose-bisphosphate aldolase/2-amino-3,7-dideoxy-D-threo-hept-6-ulosonate synthase
MIEDAGRISRDCTRWGMPLLVMIYPRGKNVDGTSPQAIGHCVRVAEEIGADFIKTNYPGSPEAFKKIVEACSVPVMIAGGEKAGDAETLKIIADSVKAGGAGVCMGRNAFQRKNTALFVKAISRVVHKNLDPDEAMGML